MSNWTFSKFIKKTQDLRKKFHEFCSYFGVDSTGTGDNKRESNACDVVRAVELVALLVGINNKRNSSASTNTKILHSVFILKIFTW